MISEKEIHNLAELARIELSKEEEGRLRGDLEKILEHFEELKEVDTAGIEPMVGGTLNENVFRADNGEQIEGEKATEDFSERAEGFLKTPPVFE
ncbi:MAG: Asp-tRNA(Asn)/Glu-tRNA(Gln) amidotransferase subunit GatC [Patescibacteria group bacterium]